MLRQTAHRERLDALLHRNPAENTAISWLASILEPIDRNSSPSTHIMSDVETADPLASGTRLNQWHYDLLLQYLNTTGMGYHSAYQITLHVQGTLILPPFALLPCQFSLDSHTYSIKESHEGNSHIQFYIPGAVGGVVETGYIEAIWEILLEGARQIFLLVQRHQLLSPSQLQKTPYAHQPGSNLQTKIVKIDDSNKVCIIEQQHIICHLAVYKNTAGTFNLTSETIMVC